MKKISIRLRYTAIFAIVLGAAIALSVFLNSVWLDKYYRISKQKTMLEAKNQLEFLLNEEMKNPPQQEPANSDGWFGTTWPETSYQGPQVLSDLEMYMNLILNESNITTLVEIQNQIISLNGMDNRWLMRMVVEQQMLLNGVMGQDSELLESTDTYRIIKNYDSEMKSFYLVCVGKFSNGGSYYLRTPLESMKESAEISNRFYIYVGIGALLLGTVVMFLVMGFVTRPIVSLTQLSKKMSDLDFEAKYTGHSRDEIGELGQHMNEMSERLEMTIAQLKAANLELQRDIDLKNNVAKERSEFVANVSHELKTPIALIQGYAEGLMDGVADDPESSAYYCEVIADEADKMNRMVKRLLTLNQLELGGEKLDMGRFDLTALVQGVVSANQLLARQKDVAIAFERREPLYVWGDEYRIEEVVTNYISNALQYVAGRNIIEIRLVEKEQICRLEVYNSGSHIPEGDLERVWDKFYKVDKARTRAYGGNGIGLSIVKAIMELHGGQCGATNQEDGVMFWAEWRNGEA